MFREITKISSKNFAKSQKFCPNLDFVSRENFKKITGVFQTKQNCRTPFSSTSTFLSFCLFWKEYKDCLHSLNLDFHLPHITNNQMVFLPATPRADNRSSATAPRENWTSRTQQVASRRGRWSEHQMPADRTARAKGHKRAWPPHPRRPRRLQAILKTATPQHKPRSY